MGSKIFTLLHNVDKASPELKEVLSQHKDALERFQIAEAQIKAWTEERDRQRLLEGRLQSRLIKLTESWSQAEAEAVKPEVLK